MRIVWSAEARVEAAAVKGWVSDDWSSHLGRVLRLLKRHPEMGRIIPEFEDETARELIVENIRIWYRVRADRIEISRVWDARRGPVEPERIGEWIASYA